MKNIIFSTTRQWNCGDEFILFGCLNLFKQLIPEGFNAIIYNRHPDIRQRQERLPYFQNIKLPNEINDYTEFLDANFRVGFRDNSIKSITDCSFVDLVVFAGTPEWSIECCRDLYELIEKYNLKTIALGIGSKPHINTGIYNRVNNKIAPFFVRDEGLLDEIGIEGAKYLPCPALLSATADDEKETKEVKKIGLIYSVNLDRSELNNCVGDETYEYMIRLYRQIIEEYSSQYEIALVCHYIDEIPYARYEFQGLACHYSYDASEYFKIYNQFDLVIGGRVHGIGICSSQGIPSIGIGHDFRKGTLAGFLAPLVSVGEPFEAVRQLINETINKAESINAKLLSHKKKTNAAYIDALKDVVQGQESNHTRDGIQSPALFPPSNEFVANAKQIVKDNKSMFDKFAHAHNQHLCRLYVDTGRGFNENEKLIEEVQTDNESCRVVFDLSKFSGIHSLRFDPAEHKFIGCKLISAESDEGELNFSPAFSFDAPEDAEDIFFSEDPQYFLNPGQAVGKRLVMRFAARQLDALELEKRVLELMDKLSDAKEELAKNEFRLASGTLFVDIGEGFNERHKVEAPYEAVDGHYKIAFNLNQFSDIKMLRFDPIEDKLCACEMISSPDAATAKDAFRNNAGEDVFFTNDPQYIIENIDSNMQLINFEIDIREAKIEEIGDYITMCAQRLEDANSKIKEHEFHVSEATLFFDTGEGFSSKNALVAKYEPFEDGYKVSFDIGRIENVQSLRFDPIENKQCACQIIDSTMPIIATNAYKNLGGEDVFFTSDPQYLSVAFDKNVKEITYYLRIREVTIDEIGLCVKELERNLALARQELEKYVFNPQKATLFVDTGEGFTESDKCESTYVKESDCYTATFNLDAFSEIRALRFDPAEGFLIDVKKCTAKVNNSSAALSPINAFIDHKGTTSFYSCDPQYLLTFTDNEAPEQVTVTIEMQQQDADTYESFIISRENLLNKLKEDLLQEQQQTTTIAKELEQTKKQYNVDTENLRLQMRILKQNILEDKRFAQLSKLGLLKGVNNLLVEGEV